MATLMSSPPSIPMLWEASTVISQPAMSARAVRRWLAMSKLLRSRWVLEVRLIIMVTDSSWAM